jgi:hypothetical protein
MTAFVVDEGGLSATGQVSSGLPMWLAPSIDVKEGRDPLGLQTTTQDRLTPRLLPGILELSRQARYFSFHSFLLDRYRSLGMPAEGTSLSTFIKRREWEYGLAVLKCPHNCKTIPVGANALRAMMAQQAPPYPRGESVESPFGGYGLYYRSPMAELGIVARTGTMLGDKPIPVDVLYDTDRARALADTFRAAVSETQYVKTWMLTSDPIPLDVLVEYAQVGCLCQLSAHPTERDAVHEALFGENPFDVPAAPKAEPSLLPNQLGSDAVGDEPLPTGGVAVTQRRRSVAHFLTLIEASPAVVEDESAFREAMWSRTDFRSDEHEYVSGQWAGLIAKDVWQEALCSMWAEFCAAGLSATRASGGVGLTGDETKALAHSLVAGPPSLSPSMPTTELVASIAAGTVSLPGIKGSLVTTSLDAIRLATVSANTATSGLITILDLHRRTLGRADAGWVSTATVRSAWQPSVTEVLARTTAHLADEPTVADSLWWFIQRFVIAVHERIAYSKLQQREHTFRFRWEEGRFQFYDNGVGRFPLAAIRDEPLSSITRNLDLWTRGPAGQAELTDRGRAFITETFG